MPGLTGRTGCSFREQLLSATFRSPAELDCALVHTMHPLGLFLQGHDGISVGDNVMVRLTVDGLEPQTLHGVVIWRRLTSAPGTPPGIGIRFEDAVARELIPLRRAAVGEEENRRLELRRTVRIPVAFLLDADPTVRSGVLSDLSTGGARIQTSWPPEEGRVLVLRPRSGAPAAAIAARVVWRGDGDAGLEILADRPVVRAAWAQIVAHRESLFPARPGTSA